MKYPRIILIFFLTFVFYSLSAKSNKQPIDYVNVFTGTSNSRWMLFPGPTMPMGMVKLSPDNQLSSWCAGYEYSISAINGFSFIHAYQMNGPSVMPTTGDIKTYPGPADGPFGSHMWTSGYKSRIEKQHEHGEVGYYKASLYDYDIDVELTSSMRCGILRYTYPKSDKSNVIFKFLYPQEEFRTTIPEATTRIVNDKEIEGSIEYNVDGNEYIVHFVTRFSKAFKSMGGFQAHPYTGEGKRYGEDWKKEVDRNENITSFKGVDDCGIYLTFDTDEREVIQQQTAISLVSVEQARLNLTTELNNFNWDFESIVAAHKAAWSDKLNKVEVFTEIEDDKVKFYTSLYRVYAGRGVLSDVNGKYTDMCENVQQIQKPVDAMYGSDALWGTQWNLTPLWTLLNPGLANSWVNSLLEMADKGGGWLPKSPSGLEYADVMVAQHQIALIVAAYQKGIRNFDVEKAWKAIKFIQTTPGKPHECGGYVGNKNLESYMKLGYVSNEDGPVSNTMEYAYDDYCAAQFAKVLGEKTDYKYFTERSLNYKNAFDSSTKFIRQRHENGDWVQEWDSLENHGTWFGSGYVEGTAWQFTYFVPHDYSGMMELVGAELFNSRLEKGFHNGNVFIGNQPNMQAPWIFNYSGKPWLTQKYTRKLLDEFFDSSPLNGWQGEEDEGQMSAWFVLSSMGLFQMDGGCSVNSAYDIGSPIFDKIVIHLDAEYYSGKTFTIKTNNNSKSNLYIQKAKLNGKPFNSLKISHADLIKGGELEFDMGDTPNFDFGK
ncbi:MAG: GH92 family glycosyl hydrolase [Candidatus Saccharimonadaceae bacterium]